MHAATDLPRRHWLTVDDYWLFGGGTVPEHRSRGIYRALVAARAALHASAATAISAWMPGVRACRF